MQRTGGAWHSPAVAWTSTAWWAQPQPATIQIESQVETNAWMRVGGPTRHAQEVKRDGRHRELHQPLVGLLCSS